MFVTFFILFACAMSSPLVPMAKQGNASLGEPVLIEVLSTPAPEAGSDVPLAVETNTKQEDGVVTAVVDRFRGIIKKLRAEVKTATVVDKYYMGNCTETINSYKHAAALAVIQVKTFTADMTACADTKTEKTADKTQRENDKKAEVQKQSEKQVHLVRIANLQSVISLLKDIQAGLHKNGTITMPTITSAQLNELSNSVMAHGMFLVLQQQQKKKSVQPADVRKIKGLINQLIADLEKSIQTETAAEKQLKEDIASKIKNLDQLISSLTQEINNADECVKKNDGLIEAQNNAGSENSKSAATEKTKCDKQHAVFKTQSQEFENEIKAVEEMIKMLGDTTEYHNLVFYPTASPTPPTASPSQSPSASPTPPTASPTAPTASPTYPTASPTSPTPAPTAPTPSPTAPTIPPLPRCIDCDMKGAHWDGCDKCCNGFGQCIQCDNIIHAGCHVCCQP